MRGNPQFETSLKKLNGGPLVVNGAHVLTKSVKL